MSYMNDYDSNKGITETLDDLREYDKYRGYQTDIITIEIKNNRRFFLNAKE